jgi:periplasmic copper chaperone A
VKRTILLAAGAALALAPAATAHVTMNPNEVAADSFARFAVRVPNERENAATTKVTVRLPEGLAFVSFQPKAGWKRTITTAKVDPPIELFGETISERVATVTWAGGRIAPGEFDEFGVSAKVPNAEGRTLVFPALQTDSNGEVVRWIGPSDADEPASRVTLGPKEEEAGSAAATPPPPPAPVAEEEDDEGESDGLALGFGIAGLAAGLVALAVSLFRRPRRA